MFEIWWGFFCVCACNCMRSADPSIFSVVYNSWRKSSTFSVMKIVKTLKTLHFKSHQPKQQHYWSHTMCVANTKNERWWQLAKSENACERFSEVIGDRNNFLLMWKRTATCLRVLEGGEREHYNRLNWTHKKPNDMGTCVRVSMRKQRADRQTSMSLIIISEKEWQIIKCIRKIIWQHNCNQLKHSQGGSVENNWVYGKWFTSNDTIWSSLNPNRVNRRMHSYIYI